MMPKAELLERLRTFLPNASQADVNYLAGQGSFTREKLQNLLLHGKQPPEV